MDRVTELKKEAAYKAVEFVESGMIVGLGTGSTSRFAIERIGELLSRGKLKEITGIPSSLESEALARRVGIPLRGFDRPITIDLTIDGADEVDANLDLIKGGGGALLREKILAQNSNREIIIVDESKLSRNLGEKWHVPVEVVPFAALAEKGYLTRLGASVQLRRTGDDQVFISDEKNYILDCNFGVINDPYLLARQMNSRAGIVEHGLFLGLASDLVVAKSDGVFHYSREEYRKRMAVDTASGQ